MCKSRHFYFIIALVNMGGTNTPVLADHLPLWELGVGVGTINAPYYRGSSQSKSYYLPFPLANYRGDFFVADEDGYRGKLFNNERLKLDISVSGNLPVPEDSTSARANMPNLDTIGEFGPSLKYLLWKEPSKLHSLQFEFPVRGVFSIGDPVVAYRGWVASPSIKWLSKYRQQGVLWRYKYSAGPIYGDGRYHRYFYEVESQYATPTRPEYHASAGYSGTRFAFSLSRISRDSFGVIFFRYDSLNNAAFEDSPLVEKDNYYFFGLAMSWIFTRSTQKARHSQ